MSHLHHTAVGALHETFAVGRRARVLSDWFSKLAPPESRILDVGCGNGFVAALLQSKRPDVKVQGIDVLQRQSPYIPVQTFDGYQIPFDDNSFNVVIFSDVLHHTRDPTILLREARRVSKYILLKDHYRKGVAAGLRLRFMDWIGNERFDVALPYNYWTRDQWSRAWSDIGVQTEKIIANLGLYPAPINWVFEAQLHFIALLASPDPTRQP